MLCAIAIAHVATALTFGHSVTNVLGTLFEHVVVLIVVVSVVAYKDEAEGTELSGSGRRCASGRRPLKRPLVVCATH